MPAFFFTIVECNETGAPAECVDCTDITDAERYAAEMAREIIMADLAAGRRELSCHIDIMDVERRQAVRVELSFSIVCTLDGDSGHNPG